MPIYFDKLKEWASKVDSANDALAQKPKSHTIDFNAIRKEAELDDEVGLDKRNPYYEITPAKLVARELAEKKRKSQEEVAKAKAYTETDEFQKLLNGTSYRDKEVETSGFTWGGEAMRAQERAIEAGKKINATAEEREVQDARDLKHAVDSGAGRFMAGLAQGVSLEPLNRYSWQEETETEKQLNELINNTTAGQAGKLAGTAIQYAMPYEMGLGGALKEVPAIAKLGKVGAEIATDAILSAPLNALNVAKEGYEGEEAFKEFLKQEALDIALGAGVEVLGSLIGTVLKSGKVIKSGNDFSNLTKEEKKEVAEKISRVKRRTLASIDEEELAELGLKPEDVPPTTYPITDKRLGQTPESKPMPPKAETVETSPNQNPEETYYVFDEEEEAFAESLAKNGFVKTGEKNIDNMAGNKMPPRETGDAKRNKLEAKIDRAAEKKLAYEQEAEHLHRLFYTQQITADEYRTRLKELRPKFFNARRDFDKFVDQIIEYDKSKPPSKDLGADTNRILPTVEENAEVYGTIEGTSTPKATAFGEVSRTAKTVDENAIVTPQAQKMFDEELVAGTFSKSYKSNPVTVEKANKTIETDGLDGAYDKFKEGLEVGNEDTIALGARLIQELQKSGDNDKLMTVVTDYIDLLSRKGRELQAASIIKRLTPEGRLVIAQKTAKRLGDQFNGANPNKYIEIKLSDDAINAIKNAKTEKEILEANKKAVIEMWNQIPADFIDKLNAYRYMSMLINPRTWARNTLGNLLFTPVRATKNALGAGMEKLFIKNGERTKTILTANDKPFLDAATKDWENIGKEVYSSGGEYSSKTRPSEAIIFRTKWLDKVRKFGSDALEWQDELVGGRVYRNSFAKYMKANNISVEDLAKNDVLEKVRLHAMKEAERATFRENTAISNAISKASRRKNNSLPQVAKSMFIEGVLPFKKTPVNVLWRGLEYSPLGFVEAAYRAINYKKHGLSSPAEVIDALAAGTTGSALLALGYHLYNLGMLNASSDKSDKSYYEDMLGKQSYSITLGDGTYTVDWISPAAMPLLVGAEVASLADGQGIDGYAVIDGLSKIADPLIETSMLKGLNDALRYNYGENPLLPAVGNILLSYANQFVPTVAGQLARTLDQTRRSTISTNESSTLRTLEKVANKNIAKLPFASTTLPEYVDVWGRTQEQGGAFAQFINPGYYSETKITPVDREIMDMGEYDESVYPSLYYKYEQTFEKEKYRMSEDDLARFQKTSGQYKYNELGQLFRTQAYKTATDDEKVKMITKVYEEANEIAKAEFLVSKGIPSQRAYLTTDKQREAYKPELGISPKEFKLALIEMGHIADTDGSGGTSSEDYQAYLNSKYGNNTALKRALFEAKAPSKWNNPY